MTSVIIWCTKEALMTRTWEDGGEREKGEKMMNLEYSYDQI